MSCPKISIIVPCWGVEKYLDHCVKSIVNQTLKELEIILIDDESPDSVPQMCDNWARIDSRVKVIHKKNAGLGMACNSGLEVATGKYVAFCDSDDWVDSGMYEHLYNIAEEQGCDAVFSAIKDVSFDGKLLKVRKRIDSTRYISGSSINDTVLDFISGPPSDINERVYEASAKIVLYSRDLLTNNNIRFVSEREIASEDLIFNINVLAHSKKICFIPDAFYNYRVNYNSISRSVNPNKFKAITAMYNYIIDDCQKLNIVGDYHIRVQRVFLGSLRVFTRQILKSTLSLNEKHRLLNNILNDNVCIRVLDEYPISSMPLYPKLYSLCLKHNCFWGTMLLSIIK